MMSPAATSPTSSGTDTGRRLHVITPVKDSIELTLRTIRSVLDSQTGVPFTYTIYNDFSTPETTARLEAEAAKGGGRLQLVNLADLTDHPSPNYRLTLCTARRKALDAGAELIIVESDVVVRPDTLQRLLDGAAARPDCAMAAALTVDAEGRVNYPYEKQACDGPTVARSHLSFCCTLLTNRFLQQADFEALDPAKSWFDVPISHMARRAGLRNYLFGHLRVEHRPHSSRPWKLLKYTNRWKYYWNKLIRRPDKI